MFYVIIKNGGDGILTHKKKKQSFNKSLKYEMYGILLITFSVIALAGGAAFGRALSKISGLLLGKWYFLILLFLIYMGLSVMIKRRWPSGWNSRKSGLTITVLTLTMISTVHTVEQRILPIAEEVSAGYIYSDIHKALSFELMQATDGGITTTMLQKDISGGYIGVLLYCTFFVLFGALGTKLFTIVMLFIGFMLATQLSYVELMKLIRLRGKRCVAIIKKKRKAYLNERQHLGKNIKNCSDKRDFSPDTYEDEEEEDNEQPVIYSHKPNRTRFATEEPELHVESHTALKDTVEDDSQLNKLLTRLTQDEESVAPLFRDFTRQREQKDEEGGNEHFGDEGSLPHHRVSWDQVQDDRANDGVHQEVEDTLQEPYYAAGIRETAVIRNPPSLPYRLPPFHLLARQLSGGKGGAQADFMQTARKLEATLESFGVRAKVLEVVRGPAVTRYEIQPDIGVKVSRIVNLSDDISLALAAKDIRMEAPIPGKSVIGIEVPNSEVSIVTMREVIESPIFIDAPSRLSISLGCDIAGTPIVGNLSGMPHLLVAGATGSGKSVCINGIIISILYKAKPDEVKFLMIDPKMVELNVYNGIPHLLAPVVTDPRRASLSLKKIVMEMEKRYELFSKSSTRNIEAYNKLVANELDKMLPYIVIIVDELADLMMVAASDVEDSICRLAQMARAAGIHLIIATQRPSVDVITGVIKANIPSRVAFGVSSQVDSRTILDMAGAEKLLGRGDMLFLPMGFSKPLRVQGAFLSDQEVEAVVAFVSKQGQAEYNEDLVPEFDESKHSPDEPIDELYEQAIQIVLETQQASASLLQRRMRIGYNRASRLIDHMHLRGLIGAHEGSRQREVLMTLEQYEQSQIR